jgi:hypothetical protein
MKTIKNIAALLLVAVVLIFPSCGGSDDPNPTPGQTEVEKAVKILTSGTWKLNAVTVDGVNKNDLFTGFTVTFTATGFTATNGEPVWPSSGLWNFSDATAKSINRSDNVTVTLESLADTAITISLTWSKTTLGTGRAESIAGKHIFSLTK